MTPTHIATSASRPFKGKNAEQGALGLFLDAVEQGTILRGSFLLIESLDRLSREEVRKSLPIFLNLINSGITIVTVGEDPPQIYSAEGIDKDMGMSLFGSMMVLMRAHNESATKSKRVKDAWDANRLKWTKGSKLISKRGPGWLKANAAGTGWIEVEKKGAVVRRIYEMAGNGT